MEEKKQRQAQEKQEQLFYAQQTMELNRMRYPTLRNHIYSPFP